MKQQAVFSHTFTLHYKQDLSSTPTIQIALSLHYKIHT